MLDVLLNFLLVALASLFIGTLSSLLGVGGGFLMVPMMIYFLNLSPKVATGTSLFVIFLSSIFTNFAYIKQNRIDFLIVAICSIFSIPASIYGSYLVFILSSVIVRKAFGAYLIFISIFMNLSNKLVKFRYKDPIEIRRNINSEVGTFSYTLKTVLIAIGSIFAGLASALFGVGGGTIIVPILSSLSYVPIHIATASSASVIFFTSLTGSIMRLHFNQIDLPTALSLLLGMLPGTQIGAKFSKKISSRSLSIIFSIFVFIL
ncbi:MAG: sulfite exporter TauE/SafE family protein, partial [Thermoproteota archaeon]